MQGSVGIGGYLRARKVGPPMASLSWRIRNKTRFSFWFGWLVVTLAKLFSRMTGIVTINSELRARVNRGGRVIYNEDGSVLKVVGGEWTDYGVLSRRLVTNNGVAFIVDAWLNTVELENMKYHGVGTGSTAESVSDSALITESTTVLNPDSTRATGTQTDPSPNILTSTATVSFDGSAAIAEHGLFSQAATGGGVLFDRSVFSAINVISGDSIQFTYSATFAAGG